MTLALELCYAKMDVHVCIHFGGAMAGKEAGLRIRVERELRDAFLDACHSQDRPASDVVREFMRCYAAKHFDGRQASLALYASNDENQVQEPETP